MALARKRKEEQARMERLRLEEEAEVAMEKVKVFDQELGVGINMEELPDMPELSARRKVERFITEQCNDISQCKDDQTAAPPLNIQDASAPGEQVGNSYGACANFSPQTPANYRANSIWRSTKGVFL